MKNKSIFNLLRSLVLGACCLMSTQFSQAVTYHFEVDTSGATGSTFAFEFQFNAGGSTSNTAIVNNIDFGGGSATGSADLIGNVAGDAGTSITLGTTPVDFFNAYYQEFTAGSSFSFDLSFGSVSHSFAPDGFALLIYNNGVPIETSDFASRFFAVELNSANPVAQVFATSVPDNGTTLSLLGGALLGLAALRQLARSRMVFGA